MKESGEVRELRAALYVRTATEHPQYSTDTQSNKIRDYASKRGIVIVNTYADDGKSGLSIFGRTGFQKLLSDVDSGQADFNLILVYDIGRRVETNRPLRFCVPSSIGRKVRNPCCLRLRSDRKSTRRNSSHLTGSRMPSSA